MNKIDISSKRINGGYFTMKSKSDIKRPFIWQTDGGKEEFFVGTYKDSGSMLRDVLIDLLRSARENIFITSFLIGDELVIEEIIAAAERLQGGVYVITALDDLSLRRGLEKYDESEKEQSPEEREKYFARLTSRGVYVRGHESCHAKFAVADNNVALLGSANFVKNGFEWTGEANVVIRSPNEVSRLKRLFSQLWYEGCTFEIPPGLHYKIEQRGAGTSPLRSPEEDISPGSIVWTNGCDSTSLLASIKDVVNGSKETLILSSFSIVGMLENPDLLFNDIVAARTRGVDVSIFVRQRNAFPRSLEALNFLHNEGVHIFGDTRNHAKVAISDGRDAVLFSANFDAKHGLNSGVEVGYRLADFEEIGCLRAYIDHAIKYSNTEYSYNPLISELDGKLAARWCSSWPLEGEIEVVKAGVQLDYLKVGSIIPAVLYEQRESGEISIWCDDNEIVGENVNGKFYGALSEIPADKSSTERLDVWLQSAGRETSSDFVCRGFFSGSMLVR